MAAAGRGYCARPATGPCGVAQTQALPAGAGADMRQAPTAVRQVVAVPAGPAVQRQTRCASQVGSPRC